MSNPEAPDSAKSSEALVSEEALKNTPNSVKEERGEKAYGTYDRFAHLSFEDLSAINVADLAAVELPAYIKATKAMLERYEKNHAVEHEKEIESVEEAEKIIAGKEEKHQKEAETAKVVAAKEIASSEPNTVESESIATESTDDATAIESDETDEPTTTESDETDEPITTESEPNINHISSEEIQENKEKSKRDPRVKNALKNVSSKALMVVMGAIAVLGTLATGLALSNAINPQNTPEVEPKQEPAHMLTVEEAFANSGAAGIALGNSALDTLLGEIQGARGIYDGYGKKGMFDSINKGTPNDFANAAEVAEEVGEDPTEILIYTATNQVESFADYLANLPAEFQPDGCKGKSILETEKWLESLSPDQYDAELANFAKIMRNNTTCEMVTLSGAYQNAYMSKSGDGATTHENTSLVACTTQENGTSAIKFVFHDTNGKEIGSMISKITVKASYEIDGQTHFVIEKDKGGCTQIVNPDGTMIHLYEDLTVIAPPDGTPEPGPGTPDDTPEPEPGTPDDTPEPEPKNQKEANENSGADAGIVTPEKQERQVTKEPVPDKAHEYNQETNTYYHTPEEQAAQISYEVEEGPNQTISGETVNGTSEGASGEAGQPNNFDAGATVGTGEVTGDTGSADGSGNTIQENLDNATGNQTANPTGDYSQGL